MRINLINPSILADQHLVAEYREIKMLPKSLMRSLRSRQGFDKSRISKTYTLNTGHGYFFYDKLNFIVDRFNNLLTEMENRNFATNYRTLELTDIPKCFFNDYSPTINEKDISLERIILRINQKPSWYKYKGQSIIDWNLFYSSNMDIL